MKLQTRVEIEKARFEIVPTDRLLFVGSCFAENIGSRIGEDQFRATVNPYGVMYNPASILHTVERAIADGKISEGIDIAVFTLGTNHVYILNETGEIVDNCQKRPQKLFTERELTVEECSEYLEKAIQKLRDLNPMAKIVLTVSPIRYAKYGFHGSQLSKATLLLAAHKVVERQGFQDDKPLQESCIEYFPAYEIMNDELRDYRFYQPDMLHPTQQAADYIYECFKDSFFSEEAKEFVEEWKPIQKALNHRPFNAETEEYKAFLRKAQDDEKRFREKWNAN